MCRLQGSALGAVLVVQAVTGTGITCVYRSRAERDNFTAAQPKSPHRYSLVHARKPNPLLTAPTSMSGAD